MHSFLKNSVFSISFGTSLSKLAGCIRQIFIAAAFGVGITYDAFNYAYIIPGFLLIIVGGINGPLHNAVVAVLTPLNKKNGGIVLTQVSIKLSIILLGFAILIYFNSRVLIELLAPNLSYEAKSIATYQLKILTPCIPLSGFIGLSFGALNSRRKFFLSSISPAITSITTIYKPSHNKHNYYFFYFIKLGFYPRKYIFKFPHIYGITSFCNFDRDFYSVCCSNLGNKKNRSLEIRVTF